MPFGLRQIRQASRSHSSLPGSPSPDDEDSRAMLVRLLTHDVRITSGTTATAVDSRLGSDDASVIDAAQVIADACRRLERILRRASDGEGSARNGTDGDAATAAYLSFPPFRLDLVNETLWRNNVARPLRAKTFVILRYFAEHPQRLVTRLELLEAIWGRVATSESLLRTHVHALRQLLGDGVLQTVNGRGYRFVPQVTRSIGQSP